MEKKSVVFSNIKVRVKRAGPSDSVGGGLA